MNDGVYALVACILTDMTIEDALAQFCGVKSKGYRGVARRVEKYLRANPEASVKATAMQFGCTVKTVYLVKRKIRGDKL